LSLIITIVRSTYNFSNRVSMSVRENPGAVKSRLRAALFEDINSGRAKAADVAGATGITEVTVTRFMGGAGMLLKSVDALCAYLGLELVKKGNASEEQDK
jgi:hypothetical protein